MLRSILSSGSIRILPYRCASSSAEAATKEIPANFAVEDDDDLDSVRQTIEAKRNKSRLLQQHHRMLNDTKPFDQSQSWIHDTVKYKRMMFGRYGMKTGIDPRICFPTENERASQEEYDRLAQPKTIQEMRQIVDEQRRQEKEAIQLREEQIEKRLTKLDGWKKELQEKVQKREAEARAAKEKKERLVEEVRRHFGFTIDPRDERFKEMLALKEKEDKKKTKEAKKVAREAKIMAKLLDQEKKDKEAQATPSES